MQVMFLNIILGNPGCLTGDSQATHRRIKKFIFGNRTNALVCEQLGYALPESEVVQAPEKVEKNRLYIIVTRIVTETMIVGYMQTEYRHG